MCIKPQRGKCQPPDGTILVLTQTKPCDQPFMQFTLSADGTLKHHCSGKMVCPRKPAQGKRCELMISSKCQPHDAKFERTAGMISKLDRSFVLHQNYPLTPRGSRGCSAVPSNTHRSRSLCYWLFTLLREVFLRVLRFSPLLKNQHFQIPIRSWNARTFLNEFLWTPWYSVGKNKYIYIFTLML